MLYLVEVEGELMYILIWFTGSKPCFVPLMAPEVYGEAIENARKIVSP